MGTTGESSRLKDKEARLLGLQVATRALYMKRESAERLDERLRRGERRISAEATSRVGERLGTSARVPFGPFALALFRLVSSRRPRRMALLSSFAGHSARILERASLACFPVCLFL